MASLDEAMLKCQLLLWGKENAEHQILFQANPDGSKSASYKNLNLPDSEPTRQPHSLIVQSRYIYNNCHGNSIPLDGM